MSIINPNLSSRTGQLHQQYQRNTDQISQSLERLSTGKRINRPSDDPAGYIAAEGLRGDLVELRAQSKVATSSRFAVRQRESALSEIQNTLNNVRGNLVAAADGLNSPTQSKAIQLEIDASLDAIDLISSQVEGVADSAALRELREGGASNVIDGDVAAAAALVDSKLSSISTARAAAGAYERTEDVFEQLRQDQIVITAETLSQIEDADYAEESSKFVQGQILAEAALLAIAYSNRSQVDLLGELLDSLDDAQQS